MEKEDATRLENKSSDQIYSHTFSLDIKAEFGAKIRQRRWKMMLKAKRTDAGNLMSEERNRSNTSLFLTE